MVVARGLVVVILLLAGLWVGYAVSAGYVGGFPGPVNFLAGLASLAALAAIAWRVAIGR